MIEGILNKRTNQVIFTSSYEDKDLLKSAGCKWDAHDKKWYLPYPSFHSLHTLAQNDVYFDKDLEVYYQRLRFNNNMAQKVKDANATDLPQVYDELYSHQNQTLAFGSQRESYADLSDCGTGKTISTLSIINDKLKENEKFLTLVVCPKSIIMSGWVEDCNKMFPKIKIIPAVGSFDKKVEAFQTDANIYVTNYETLHQDRLNIEGANIDMIVFDEAVRLKNPKSRWTERAIKLSKIIKHKVIISGLITPNNLMEVYAPFSVVEPSVLGNSFYQFREKYFSPNPYSYMNKEMIPKKGALEKITGILEPLIIRHKKSECLDLPEKIHTCKYIPMEKEQQKAYDSMLKSFMLEVEDGVVTAFSKGAVLQKLSQITSGFIYSEAGESASAVYFQYATAKIAELKSMLNGELINEQVVIFCTYKGEINLFREHFPESAFIYGGQSTDEQEAEIKAFKSGDKQLLFANIKASKYGLTFTNCSYVIYFSMSYSLDDMYQSEERIHRIGQKQTCNYIYLLADKTTDKRVYDSIRKKQELNDMVYSMIEDYNKETK